MNRHSARFFQHQCVLFSSKLVQLSPSSLTKFKISNTRYNLQAFIFMSYRGFTLFTEAIHKGKSQPSGHWCGYQINTGQFDIKEFRLIVIKV